VTPGTHAAFLGQFNDAKGFCRLHFTAYNGHLVMGLGPPARGKAADCYLWARNYNGTLPGMEDCRGMYMAFNRQGYVIPVNLGPKVQHLKKWLKAREQDRLFADGNCQEWLPNAEVAPGRPLFHEMGLRRSRSGPNMKAKILHAATAASVDVVGVYVDSPEVFNGLSMQQLLGPPPGGGVADAMR
jgi:hypothetical protein